MGIALDYDTKEYNAETDDVHLINMKLLQDILKELKILNSK